MKLLLKRNIRYIFANFLNTLKSELLSKQPKKNNNAA